MAVIGLDHIGIAISDSNSSLIRLLNLLQCEKYDSEKVPSEGINVHFHRVSGGAPRIELLEVIDPQSSVAKFLARRGPGVHHLAFLLEPGTLKPVCEKLSKNGYEFIFSEPKSGAQNKMINFVHPKSCDGVLVELMESKS